MGNYYRIDLKCRVWDEPYKKFHIAGRHVFVKADNVEEAIEKCKNKYRHECDLKILKVSQIDFIPSIGLIK